VGIAAVILWTTGIYFALRVIHDGRTSQGTLGWVVLLLLFPPLGIPLYFLFGERRLEGYVRARRGGRRSLDEFYKSVVKAFASVANQPSDPTLQVLSAMSGLAWTSGNRVRLFHHADPMYEQLARAINGAQRTLLVQFYIYRDDETGRLIRNCIRAACERGVAVSVMYDELGCVSLPASYFQPIKDAGGAVSGFRTVAHKRRLLRLNFRNHRKLVVVDGHTLFFGGMNIGDEYRGLDEEIGPWRDTHVLAVGPCAIAAQLVFAEDWHWAQRSMPQGIQWTVPANLDADAPAREQEPCESEVQRMLLFPSGPSDEREVGVLMCLQLIARAQTRLWIATPYFVCDESIIQAIGLARLRGVDVRIIVPRHTDQPIVHLAAQSFIRDAVAFKAMVYKYARAFAHHKVILCDDVAVIGSLNLDNRSMKLNFELMGLIDDKALASQIVAMFERDFRHATLVPNGWWERLTSMQRFKIRLARLAAPIL